MADDKNNNRPASALPQANPFAIGERVVGTGIAGEVVEQPGPYSVIVRQDGSGVRITASVTTLRKG